MQLPGIVHLALAAALLANHGACAKEGSIRATEATDGDMTEVLRNVLKNKPSDLGHRDLSTTIVMTFEGVKDGYPVADYYNGVGGPNYGVVFGSSVYALVDADAGGRGNIANEPSPETVVCFAYGFDFTMTAAAGFIGLSFYYASDVEMTITLYDGPGGSGNVLASVLLPRTGVCDYDFPDCGDPTGQFGKWVLSNVPFSGVAKSARFTYDTAYGALLDDVTITTCSETTYWLWDPATDTVLGELKNGDGTCLPPKYNIEFRPCPPPKKMPVSMKLKDATGSVVHGQDEYFAPFYLWGDNTDTKDVWASKKPLPNGKYSINTKVDGKTQYFTFTQAC